MRHERIAVVDGLNLRKRPYAIGGREYAPDLPDARLTEFGRTAQLAGAKRHPTHYDDAPWQISVLVSNPTDALLDELTAAFHPGARLVWGEGLAPRFTEIRTSQCDAIRYEKNHLAVVTFSGTREPGWWSVTDHVVVMGSLTGWGTFDIADVGGEFCTPATLRVWTSAAASLIACGIVVDPGATYSPVNYTNYTGVSVSTAWANVSSQSINARTNAGNHIVIASLSHAASPATAMLFRAGSSFAGGAAKYQPPVRATGASMWAEVGQISIPAGAYSPDSFVTLTAPQEPGIAPSGGEQWGPDSLLAYRFPTPGAVLEYLDIKPSSAIVVTSDTGMDDAASDGEGTWLVVGSASSTGAMSVSHDDGRTFSPLSGLPATERFTSVAYGNGAWVVTTGESAAYVSVDLETWTGIGYASKVSFAGGLFFLAVGAYSKVSATGLPGSWTEQLTGIIIQGGVVYHDGLMLYVAAGYPPPPDILGGVYDGMTYAVSADGLTWTGHDDPFDGAYITGITSSGSRLVAVSESSGIWKSDDAETWTLVSGTASHQYAGVGYGAGRFYAAVADDFVDSFLVSADGALWSPLSSAPLLAVGLAARFAAGTWIFCSQGGVGRLDTPLDVPMELWTLDGDRLGYRVWRGTVEAGSGQPVRIHPRVDVADLDELVLIHPVSALASATDPPGRRRSRLLMGSIGPGSAHTVSSARSGAVLASEIPYPGHPHMVTGTRNLQTATGASILQAKADSGATTVTQWSLVRVPIDHGAFVTGGTSAGAGVAFDPLLGAAYPISSNGTITGPALATRNFGEGFSLAPGSLNRLVITGSEFTTYEVSYRPCYLHRA